MGSKKVIMTNKVVRQASKCDVYVANRSRFLKQPEKEVLGTRLIISFFYILNASHCKTYHIV